MKNRIIAVILLAIMLFTLVACDVNGQSKNITIKGCFALEPNEENFKDAFDENEGLDSTLQYFFVVYDVNVATNTELVGDDTFVKLTMNGNNTYEQLSPDTGVYLKAFLGRCGYAVSSNDTMLYSGDSKRMVAVFAINKNDITENTTAKIEIHLNDRLKTTNKISASDISTIDYMDYIFNVEDNPEQYILKCSLKAKADVSYWALNAMCELSNSISSAAKYNEEIMIGMAMVIYFWDESSIGESMLSASSAIDTSGEDSDKIIFFEEDFQYLTYEKIREYFSDVADEIDKIHEVASERGGYISNDKYSLSKKFNEMQKLFEDWRDSMSNIQKHLEKY